jgi:hypothetical protein
MNDSNSVQAARHDASRRIEKRMPAKEKYALWPA